MRRLSVFIQKNCQEIFESKWVKTRFFSTKKSPGRKNRRNERLCASLSVSTHYKGKTLIRCNSPPRLHRTRRSFAASEAVVCINRRARWYQTTGSIAAFHALKHHPRPPPETQMTSSGTSKPQTKCLLTPSPFAKTAKNPDQNLSIKFQFFIFTERRRDHRDTGTHPTPTGGDRGGQNPEEIPLTGIYGN